MHACVCLFLCASFFNGSVGLGEKNVERRKACAILPQKISDPPRGCRPRCVISRSCTMDIYREKRGYAQKRREEARCSTKTFHRAFSTIEFFSPFFDFFLIHFTMVHVFSPKLENVFSFFANSSYSFFRRRVCYSCVGLNG